MQLVVVADAKDIHVLSMIRREREYLLNGPAAALGLLSNHLLVLRLVS